jgi:hypothetical protein
MAVRGRANPQSSTGMARLGFWLSLDWQVMGKQLNPTVSSLVLVTHSLIVCYCRERAHG